MKYRIRNTGFTLVELIIVVIVIGILAAVGMPQYSKAIEKARGAEAMAGINNIQQAEKIYFSEKEDYYQTSNTLPVGITSTEQKDLDVNLPQKGWAFKVEIPSGGTVTVGSVTVDTAYRVIAQRTTGACVGRKIIFDHKGNLIDASGTTVTDSEWDTCQKGL